MEEFYFDPKKMKKQFGRAMALKGWNKSQVALRCEISAGLLSKILSGERSSTTTIAKIAKKLDVPLHTIIKDEELAI